TDIQYCPQGRRPAQAQRSNCSPDERSEIRDSALYLEDRSRMSLTLMRATSDQISFNPLKLACPSLPTMMWSCTAMPKGRAASTIMRVISMPARDGLRDVVQLLNA